MADSCILAQFERLAELSDHEKELLVSLEKNPVTYSADTVIRAADSEASNFFTLRTGWACAVRELADGERQVVDIFLPGQVMGLREIGYDRSLSSFITLNEAELCPFPKTRLTEIFDEAPRLSDLFFLILAREQSMLVERVINIGRRPAAERLAHFIIEMKIRLNQTSCQFELPMRQAIIGDALGLTSVHVSRTLKRLRDDRLVSVTDGMVHIEDFDALVEFSEFNSAYLTNDVSWVRQGLIDGVPTNES